MDTRCKAVTKSGVACSAQPFRDGWCRWHHPQLEAERREARRQGGTARSNKARAKKALSGAAMSAPVLAGFLSLTIQRVYRGEVEPGVGSAIASLAKAQVSVTESAKGEEIAARLDRVEAALRRQGAA
jgi:hypothetical protein